MALTLDDIIGLYRIAGTARYGMEAINQAQHALQCGVLAQEAGAHDALVTAALLHDLGHLITDTMTETAPRKDDLHEYRAVPFLRPLFPDAVILPIAMHVAAKRYLCAADPGYFDTLSPASRHSLALQGGAFEADAAARFIDQPFARDAVQLRIWDDQAKDPRRATPGWSHFRPVMARAGRREAAPQA